MYDIVWQIYHTWCFHCYMYQIFGRRYKKCSFVLLCEQKISYIDVTEITSQVIWSLKWALRPRINILLLFLVVERGLNSYSMSLHQICMPFIARESSDMYQKIILIRDLAIWSFISILIWKQNLHLILLFIANNVIIVKFLFLGSILPHKLIWDSSYWRGMICYLHFRRHIRFTNIIAIHMYCTVLLFITMMFVALTNR